MIFDENLPDIVKFNTIRPLLDLLKEDYSFYPLEAVLGFNDDRRWYKILGYNEYEISNDNFIRSNRRWQRFPYGTLIEPFKYDRDGMGYYNLSDNKDKMNLLHISQIQLLRDKANQNKYGHPYYTEVVHYYGPDRGAYIKKSFDSNEELMEFRKKNSNKQDEYHFNESPIKIIKKIEVQQDE